LDRENLFSKKYDHSYYILIYLIIALLNEFLIDIYDKTFDKSENNYIYDIANSFLYNVERV